MTKPKTRPEKVRIKQYWYTVAWDANTVTLIPMGPGSQASSEIDYNNYAYTHGDHVYQHAINRAKKLKEDHIDA